MVVKTEKNIEALSSEAVDQMDMKTLVGEARDKLETYYRSLSEEEFDKEWRYIFDE
jgi:hypothetical protein